MFKVCFKCDKPKPLSEFYRHPCMADGYLGKCKECTKRDVTASRNKNRHHYRQYEHDRFKLPSRKKQVLAAAIKRRRLHPEKTAAYNKVRRAIKNGSLVRLPCLICGDPRSQAHHRDYSRPLDVEWLCFKHHREAHGQVVG